MFISSSMGMGLFGTYTERVDYTTLTESITSGEISAVQVEMGRNSTAYVKAKLTTSSENGAEVYYTAYVPADSFVSFLEEYQLTAPASFKVEYDILSEDSLSSILMMVMTLGLMLMLIFFFFSQNSSSSSGGKMMNFGKSKAKLYGADETKVSFKDVAGADEEKAELEEIVEFLKNPEKFRKLGARIPKGVLLVGPPGTGKTLIAKATAGEAGVPFFSISGSDFVEMFVGVGASRVRDLFDSAKKNAPCIVFIDEIDAVGRQRGAGLGGGNDEREQTLNQLLVEMDGFEANTGIIVIAATNRSDILDPALTRPGRFDRQIVVHLPDVRGREDILKVHCRNKPIAKTVDLKTIARATSGFTGADLENLMNEAALLSARAGRKDIGMGEINEAIKRVIAGPEKKSRVVTAKDNKITATHEAGHALIEHLLPNCDRVSEISIIARGMAAGYTISLPESDDNHMTRGKLLDEITALLGGRAAEAILLDDITTGAISDIERATQIARKMITAYGMSETLGPISLEGDSEVFVGKDLMKSKTLSDDLYALIDAETRAIIDRCYEKAMKLISENKDKMDLIVKHLLERESLSGREFEMLMDEGEEAMLRTFPTGTNSWDISIIDVPKSSKTKIEPIVDTVEEVLPEEKISEAMDVLRDAREKSESVDSVEGQTDGEEVASSVDENEGNK
ncbi:MAG: ATP-dependent zinc metalloprotease FtsH [Anaerofustis stercorihominis]|nr:ATP-dependent zinc metalloprotease FtsH [Anaerofustis stercorihominis]